MIDVAILGVLETGSVAENTLKELCNRLLGFVAAFQRILILDILTLTARRDISECGR